LLIFACASDTDAPVQPVTPVTPVAPVTDTPVLTRSVVESGLSAPWDVAISSDGALFYTERCAGLSVRRSNGTRARLFGTTGSALVAPDLFCLGQSGMNGVALDPGFATNRLLYVFMASTLTTSPRTNRVVRLQLDAGYTTVSARTDIVTDIAFSYLVARMVFGAGHPAIPFLLLLAIDEWFNIDVVTSVNSCYLQGCIDLYSSEGGGEVAIDFLALASISDDAR
jgi:glucose/arabinose dehydrogenase